MYLLGLLMTFCSVSLIVYLCGAAVTARRTTIQRRLETVTGEFDDRALQEAVLSQNNLHNKKAVGTPGVSRIIRDLEKELAKTELLLKPQEYILISAGITVTLAAFLYLASRNMFMLLLGILCGLLGSLVYLNIKKKQRTARINHQLVDTITLISNGLKAGYSFLQAAEMVSRDMRPPMATEFKRLIRQMHMGMTAEEALKKLNERVESPDMDLLITAILIQRQIGGNLAEVLDKITETIQGRIRLKRDISTKTAQGRVSGLVLMLISPCLGFVIYFINPGFMNGLFTSAVGLLLVGAAVILQLIGVYFLVKITRIEV